MSHAGHALQQPEQRTSCCLVQHDVMRQPAICRSMRRAWAWYGQLASIRGRFSSTPISTRHPPKSYGRVSCKYYSFLGLLRYRRKAIKCLVVCRLSAHMRVEQRQGSTKSKRCSSISRRVHSACGDQLRAACVEKRAMLVGQGDGLCRGEAHEESNVVIPQRQVQTVASR